MLDILKAHFEVATPSLIVVQQNIGNDECFSLCFVQVRIQYVCELVRHGLDEAAFDVSSRSIDGNV